MKLILLSNKEIFAGNSGPISKKFSVVNQQNQSWLFELRPKSLITALKRLQIESLLAVHFALRINTLGQQQNTPYFANGA